MMTILRVILAFAISIYFTLMSFGCATVSLVAGGRVQTFHGSESLELKRPVPNILDVVAEIGKSMGYDVSAGGSNTIHLQFKSSLTTTILVGKANSGFINVRSVLNGKGLGIWVFVVGNFGTGTQEEATKLLSDFKNKLSSKIGQQLEVVVKLTPVELPDETTLKKLTELASREFKEFYSSSFVEIYANKNFAELENTGEQFEAKFDYQEALRFYQKGLDLAKEADNKRAVGVFLHHIGSIYSNVGYESKALSYYDQALRIFNDIGDTRSQLTVLILMAGIKQEEGNFTEALSYLEKVAMNPRDHAGVVELAIGEIYLEQGRLEEAFQILQRAPYSSFGLGRYYLKKEQYEKAKVQFYDDLIGFKDLERIKPWILIGPYIGLGISNEGLRQYREAKDCFQKAIEVIERERQALTGSQRQNFFSREVWGFPRLEPYEGMIRVLIKEKAEGYVSKAFFYAERVKARSFLDILALRDIEGKSLEDKAVLEKDKKFQETLLGLRDQGSSKELKRMQDQYEEFINEVKLRFSEVASLISVNPAPVQEIQSKLDKDVTLLEYYTTRDKTYAWLLTKDDIKVYEIALTEKDWKEKVDRFLLPNISNHSRKAEPAIILSPGDEVDKETPEKEREENRERFYHVASDFYNIIMAPIEKDIKTEKLIIIPHGVLHKVPFSTLTDGQKYLIDKYAISVFPSASVMEFIEKKRKPEKEKLLILANPQTDYVPLRFAEIEGKTLSTLFPGGEVYYRERATETLAKKRSSDFNIIHFASHGEFNERQPLQSGLLLTKDQENDGYLQVHEIFGMDLRNANLVTLSACETALSKVTGGDDLVGLSRGFIYAGTPSLLATLWKVDDRSTSILMEHFYRNWQKGMSKPEALRQAQISLKNMPQYKHPFYWAPFVMIGDWK